MGSARRFEARREVTGVGGGRELRQDRHQHRRAAESSAQWRKDRRELRVLKMDPRCPIDDMELVAMTLMKK